MTNPTASRETHTTALRWLVVVLLAAALTSLAAACRGGGNATPPPATIIRVTGEAPAATQPVPGETLPMPPTVPELPTTAGGSDPYPLPTEAVTPQDATPTPLVYPSS